MNQAHYRIALDVDLADAQVQLICRRGDTSRVLRGSHDGFGESVMKNAALLRRRFGCRFGRGAENPSYWSCRRTRIAAIGLPDGFHTALCRFPSPC